MPAWTAQFTNAKESDSQLIDLHVHLTNKFSIKSAMEVAQQRNLKFGIVEHPGVSFGLKNDADLKNYITTLRSYPVYVGLQPTYRNWRRGFSAELLQQVDYILMDPQHVPQPDGSFLSIWEYNTHVPDTELFMKQYMDYSLDILNNEPINIFGWPLFLPVCIARDYYKLWTTERKQQIITAAKAKNIAIEINEMAHVPDESFILLAKEQGLKFTLGTDARTKEGAGRLVYGPDVIKKCKLTPEDFYVPKRGTGI